MFSTIFRILCIASVLLGAGAYLFYLHTGSVPHLRELSTSDSRNEGISSPMDLLADPSFSSLKQPEQPLYKWRENGRWHYGPKAPKDAKAVRVDIDDRP